VDPCRALRLRETLERSQLGQFAVTARGKKREREVQMSKVIQRYEVKVKRELEEQRLIRWRYSQLIFE